MYIHAKFSALLILLHAKTHTYSANKKEIFELSYFNDFQNIFFEMTRVIKRAM